MGLGLAASLLTPCGERRLHSPSLLSLFPLGSSSSDFILLFLSHLSDRYTLYAYVPDPSLAAARSLSRSLTPLLYTTSKHLQEKRTSEACRRPGIEASRHFARHVASVTRSSHSFVLWGTIPWAESHA